jgi:hypothetical protein
MLDGMFLLLFLVSFLKGSLLGDLDDLLLDLQYLFLYNLLFFFDSLLDRLGFDDGVRDFEVLIGVLSSLFHDDSFLYTDRFFCGFSNLALDFL